MNGPGRTAVVVGGTGLVGGSVVERLAKEPAVERVVVPVRREVERWRGRPNVGFVRVDFEALEDHADAFRCEQVFLCLGTTRKKAGSPEAFRRVDHDYTLAAARLAAAGGARAAFLVSSLGASPSSRVFYSRVKGEVEEALRALALDAVHVFRPSILTGERAESRPLERAGILAATALAPFMVGAARRYRPIAAADVARAMVSVARVPRAGFHVHDSEEVARLAASA